MRIAVLELLRKPSRFVFVGGALSVLVVLILFLGALLDGLYLNSTGAIRATEADAFVFSDDARESFLRSSIAEAEFVAIAATDGVEEVGGIGFTLLGLSVPGEDDLADGAVVGYELASGALPTPPPPGEAYADRSLGDVGADIGDVISVGPAGTEIEIVGWVEDSNYLQQSGLWVEPDTWRRVQNENRPDAPVGASEFQAAAVRVEPGADVSAVGAAIDAGTGNTRSLSESETILAIPGIEEQSATFNAVIVATVLVAALVVTLFFVLLTVERTSLYAMYKALGASSLRIMTGVVTQAVLISAGAFVVAGLLTFGLAQVVPPEVPAEFEVSRAITTVVAVLATSILGSLISLRRITQIEPASALGAGV